MEDDDIAANSQDLLDAIDAILLDAKLVKPLSADDLNTIRRHRASVALELQVYRRYSGFTERRKGGPRPALGGDQKRQLSAAMNSAALAAVLPFGLRFGLAATAGGGGAGGIGVGVVRAAAGAGAGESAAALLTRVVVPLAAITFFALLDDSYHPSAKELARWRVSSVRNLKARVLALMRDIADLDAVTAILAITAATTTKELLDRLKDAVNLDRDFAEHVITAIVNELIRRFPKCAAIIHAAGQEQLRAKNWTSGVMELTRQGRLPNPYLQSAADSLKALETCIAYHGSLP